jgi:hypothetical protein
VQVAMGGHNRKRRGGKEAKARRALKRAAGRANGGVPSVYGGAGDGDVGSSQPVDDVHVGSVTQPGSARLCDEIAAAELYEKNLATRERAAAWAGASASAAVAAAALVILGFDEEEKAAEAAELEEDAQAELAELAFSLGGLQLGLDEDDEAADLAEEEGNIVVPGAASGGVGPESVVPLLAASSSDDEAYDTGGAAQPTEVVPGPRDGIYLYHLHDTSMKIGNLD